MSKKIILTVAALLIVAAYVGSRVGSYESAESSSEQADQDQNSDPHRHQRSHQHRARAAATATPVPQPKRSVAQVPRSSGEGNLEDLQAKAKTPFQIRKDGLDGRMRTLLRGQFSIDGSGPKEERVASFVQRYAKSLFGVDPENLRLEKVEGADRERYVFAHEIDGISVFGSRLVVAVEGAEVVRLQNDLVPPGGEVLSNERMSIKDALNEYYKNEGLEVKGEVAADQSSRVYMPGTEAFVLAYQAIVTQRAPGQPTESYMVILDARNGQVLKKILMTVN